MRKLLSKIGFAMAVGAAAGLGALTMRGKGRPEGRWFRMLRKPRFQPPDRVFGPVWTVLYATIAYSGWRVWSRPASRARTGALGLWGAQLALNAAWTPLFFGARRPGFALADLVALDAAATSYALTARKVDARAAWAVVPYLAWLGFATVLNTTIFAKNRAPACRIRGASLVVPS
ncbi:MAG: tryptophan-rich sensory protein [Deltaproteobacteria bacterium]|nr:tryptophan-rich sensory protein [Deltaproteobacteria bacterium]